MAAGLLIATIQAMSKREPTRRLKALPNIPSIMLLLGLDVRLDEARVTRCTGGHRSRSKRAKTKYPCYTIRGSVDLFLFSTHA